MLYMYTCMLQEIGFLYRMWSIIYKDVIVKIDTIVLENLLQKTSNTR